MMMNLRADNCNHKSKIQMRVTKLSKIIVSTILIVNLTGCATYKSSFNCGDSKGVYCAPMDRVDQMINSGEIERFNEQSQKKEKYKPLKNSDTPKLKEKQGQNNIEVSNVYI
tara:strand:+ start:2164 stop:2499 length:336 start_codon:yes stop_codon:yes gene_type:complete